jgi:hypothetical protein
MLPSASPAFFFFETSTTERQQQYFAALERTASQLLNRVSKRSACSDRHPDTDKQ